MKACFAAALLLPAVIHGSDPEVIKPRKDDMLVTVISSKIYNGYQRTQTADGKTKPETYAFGDGEALTEGAVDRYLEKVTFSEVAQTLAGPLAQQAYITGSPPAQTDLLIMVKWGSTGMHDNSAAGGTAAGLPYFMPTEVAPGVFSKPSNPMVEQMPVQPGVMGGGGGADTDPLRAFEQMTGFQNQIRDRSNARTARLLGYDDELERIRLYDAFVGMKDYQAELVSDLEDARYFVVLVAYDFQKLWKEKQKKVLWITRYSIRSRGSRFDRDLAAMSQMASKYFGQDTNGLKRDVGGRVNLGELKILDDAVKK